MESTYEGIENELGTIINKTLISVAQNSINNISSKQSLSISGLRADEDVIISSAKQITIAVIDSQKFLSIIDEATYKLDMTDAVTEAANTNSALYSILSTATGGTNETSEVIVQKNIARVADSYTYSSFSSIVSDYTGSGDIVIKNIKAGTIDLGNISQYVQVELIGKQVANVMVKKVMEIAAESEGADDGGEDDATDEDATYRKYIIIAVIVFIVAIALIVFAMIAKTAILGAATERNECHVRNIHN